MLKIKRNKGKDTGVKFKTLKVGELFTNCDWVLYDNRDNVTGLEVCMKIEDIDGACCNDRTINCVSLDDGMSTHLDNDHTVYKVTGELTITSGKVFP